MQVKRYGKLAAVLFIMVLFCFIFAGAAMATPSNYDIYVHNGNPETGADTNIVKAGDTYGYWLDLKLDPSIDVIAIGNKSIDIVFPGGFDLSPAVGKTVQLLVTVCQDGNQEDRLMQIVPAISGQTATFVIQSQNLPESGEVRNIQIQGLSVTNPCTPGNYCIEVHSPCFNFTCMAMKVVETVGNIVITEPLTVTPVKGGTSVTVKGEVRDACGNPWPYDTWPVIIDIVDLKGRPAMDGTDCIPGVNIEDGNVICPVIAHTVMGGNATTFTATIKVPAQGYDFEGSFIHDYLIRARTVEVKDIVGGDTGIEFEEAFGLNSSDMIPATGRSYLTEELDWKGEGIYWNGYCFNSDQPHSWIAAEPQKVESTPGVLADVTIAADGDYKVIDGEVTNFILNKTINVTLCGTDKFCRLTDASGLKFDLLAEQNGNVAGVFLDESGNQISHVYVPAGASCVTVKFVPAVAGEINLEGRSIIGGVSKVASTTIGVVSEYTAELEVLPIVTDESGNPRAGWPLKASVWLKDASGNVISASEDWVVKVALMNQNYTGPSDFFLKDVTWDTSLNVCYNAEGTKRGYADFYTDLADFSNRWDETCFTGWDSYIHPYCTPKSHFYIYTPPSVEGKNLVVEISVWSKATGQLLSYDYEYVNFVSPVEMVRGLDSETWQTFSTPKYLANPEDCSTYGTFRDLLKQQNGKDYVWDSETLILSYQNGGWRVMSPDSVVEPLMCYYIRTRQPLAPGDRNDYWVAQYVFDRATSPSEMIPPIRELQKGWNSVGLTVCQPQYNSGPFEVEQTNMVEADYLYHALGSICDCCKLLWNPGNSVGNLAPWSVASLNSGTLPAWAYDPTFIAVNGDNYWMYINCDNAVLAANCGLDLVDP